MATDFASYPDWNPNITKVEVLDRDDSGRPTKVWMEVDAKLKTISYTLGYVYSDAPMALSWSLADVNELEGSYAFEQSGDVTLVSYDMRIDPGFLVPTLLRSQAERQIARAVLEA